MPRSQTGEQHQQAPYWSQGLNRYSYVFNDPVNNTDPTAFVTGNDAAAMYAPFHVPAMTTMGALGSGLGFATGPLSVGTTLLGGGAGFAQAGGTMNVAARQAAVGGGTGQGGTHATAQNTPVVADGDGAGSLAPHRRTAGPPDASGRPTMMTRLGPQTIPRFRSADAAAYWAAHIMNPASIAADREMLTAIIRIGKSLYTFTPPVWGGKNTVPGAHLIYADLIAEGADVVAMLHTHSRAGATSEYFSANDFGFANYTGVPLYLASPNGILSELEPMLATPTYLPNGHVPVFEPTRIIGRLPNDVWSPLPLPH